MLITSPKDLDSFWTSRISQYLVLKPYPFPKLVELYATNYDPSLLDIASMDGKCKLFTISIGIISNTMNIPRGAHVIFVKNCVNFYRI